MGLVYFFSEMMFVQQRACEIQIANLSENAHVRDVFEPLTHIHFFSPQIRLINKKKCQWD